MKTKKLPFLLLLLSLFLACQEEDKKSSSKKKSNDNGETEESCVDVKPVIKNLLIDIDSWDNSDPGTVGDFTFDSSYTYDQHIYAFGEFISLTKQLGNIEFHTKQDAQVKSPVDGYIESIAQNTPETKGYELFIKTQEDSCFTVIIDHVRNLTVSVGDTIEAGDILGIPGQFGGSLGQVELQINDDKREGIWCALALMSEADQSIWAAKIDDFRDDWEGLISDTDVYDESKDWNGLGLCQDNFIKDTDLVND